MQYYIEYQCKKFSYNKTDKTQTIFGWKVKDGGSISGGHVPFAFSIEACKQALAEMIIFDELPFRFV